MFSFLFKKDPNGVNKRMIRRYMKLSNRCNYHLRVSGDIAAGRAAYNELERIRATANEATIKAINVAIEVRDGRRWA